MSQAAILHQAKQGDPKAIASLLNQSLYYRKAEITDATFEEDCLQIRLESPKIPNQHKLIPHLRDELISLDIKIVKKLHIAAFVTGTENQAWEETLTFAEDVAPVAPKSNIISAKSDDVALEEASLELRAKRGEQAAIIGLLNHDLEPRNLTTQGRFNKGYLQVLVEGEYLHDKEELVQIIRQKLLDVKLPLVKKVTVYGKITEDNVPLWHQDFDNSIHK